MEISVNLSDIMIIKSELIFMYTQWFELLIDGKYFFYWCFQFDKTHLDFRRKNFDLEDVFFLFFPFTIDAFVLSIFSISHFNFALVALLVLDTPNNVLSLIFLLVVEACSWFCCCFFDVVKFCIKQNITLRVIAYLSTFRATKHKKRAASPQNHPHLFMHGIR